MVQFVVLNLRCYYFLVVSVHSTWAFDESFIIKFLPQMVSQLWKQGKGAGNNSKSKEDKEAKLEGGEIRSQGQFMKEGRKDLLLDREAFNLIHDRSQPSLPSCHFLKKYFALSSSFFESILVAVFCLSFCLQYIWHKVFLLNFWWQFLRDLDCYFQEWGFLNVP